MAKVRLVTDSTNCLPPELVAQYNIKVVPVGLVLGGKIYRDFIDMTPDQFWRLFPTLTEEPTTSAGSPGDFVTAFTEVVQAGQDVVCVLLTKALTATAESAFLARKLVKADFPNANIHIIDSRTSAGALGFVVLEAARAAEAGKSTEDVLAVVDDMCSRVLYLSAVESLRYMIRIGRVPRNAEIGEKLGVKPIIGLVGDSGYTEVVSRVSGKENALKKIVDLVKKYIDPKLPLHIMVHYSLKKEDGEALRDLMLARYKVTEAYFTTYSPVMVAATGPMVGVSFYS